MHLAYYDESGDDGYPEYSSPLFVLTALYLDHAQWRPTYERIAQFRRELAKSRGLPVKVEFHTKQLLLSKDPYRNLGCGPQDRRAVVDEFCAFLAGLETVRIANVMTNKRAIRHPAYDVLDTALTYSIQRVENDLRQIRPADPHFPIITDEGPIGSMRRTARRIQRINYLPSKFGSVSVRREIQSLIEDPLPKASRESYFIQIADLVSYLVSLYSTGTARGHLPNRLADVADREAIYRWLDTIKSRLNLEAAPDDRFGVKIHPGE